MFRQLIAKGILYIIHTFYLCLYVVIFVGTRGLGSVPVRTANVGLPVGRSYFLTGQFFLGMDCIKFITATRKLTKQISYRSQLEIIISIYEGQHAISQI